MLSLMLMLFFIFMMASIWARLARRRRRIEEERARVEAAERGGNGSAGESPFSMMPFGGLFEQMMTMGGGGSYTYDPQTGEWVEIRPEEPAPEPTTAHEAAPKTRRRRQS